MLTSGLCSGEGLANESISGRSTGPILMPFTGIVVQGVNYIRCKFGEVWLGGRYLKLVRNIAGRYEKHCVNGLSHNM